MANTVVISGRVASEIKINRKMLPTQKILPWTKFFVAVEDYDGSKAVVDFIPVTAFGAIAYTLEKVKFRKGMGIEITGKLRTTRGMSKAGTMTTMWNVIATQMRFPPTNEKFEEPEIPQELPPMSTVPENPIPPTKEEAKAEEADPVVAFVQKEEEPQVPYNYYEEEADPNNFLPPEM